MNLSMQSVPDRTLTVCISIITAPFGNDVSCTVRGSAKSGFDVQYTPVEAGQHTIQIEYANMEIRGSPFYPQVYDASLVTVGPIEDGLVGELVQFEGV